MKMVNDLNWTDEERGLADRVICHIITESEANVRIKLPDFDPEKDQPSETVACATVGIEPNVFGGRVGEFRYQFEGEEDLLHLIITRIDQQKCEKEPAQKIASHLFRGVPPALIWSKWGEFTHHFYLGHDDLIRYWSGERS